MKQYTKEQLTELVHGISKSVEEETIIKILEMFEELKKIEDSERAVLMALTLLYIQAQTNYENTIIEVLNRLLNYE